MGLCQQHDVLYENLTVEEHLRMMCQMKMLESEKIDKRVKEILDMVTLGKDRDVLSANLSGG